MAWLGQFMRGIFLSPVGCAARTESVRSDVRVGIESNRLAAGTENLMAHSVQNDSFELDQHERIYIPLYKRGIRQISPSPSLSKRGNSLGSGNSPFEQKGDTGGFFEKQHS